MPAMSTDGAAMDDWDASAMRSSAQSAMAIAEHALQGSEQKLPAADTAAAAATPSAKHAATAKPSKPSSSSSPSSSHDDSRFRSMMAMESTASAAATTSTAAAAPSAAAQRAAAAVPPSTIMFGAPPPHGIGSHRSPSSTHASAGGAQQHGHSMHGKFSDGAAPRYDNSHPVLLHSASHSASADLAGQPQPRRTAAPSAASRLIPRWHDWVHQRRQAKQSLQQQRRSDELELLQESSS
eukprot:PLAT1845.1.p1 GENE.PLAT1845.1~~PLAT1845.1.p1  ORF type:complete len:238 (-),score=103.18 PLAT1845.1:42-755(-)